MLPLDKLLLETDSPYFPPYKGRGGATPSLPSDVLHVAAMVARLKDVPLATVLEENLRGVSEIYKINSDRSNRGVVTKAKLLSTERKLSMIKFK